MAYFHEETIKQSLIKAIYALSNTLKIEIEVPPIELTTYENLIEFRDELQNEMLSRKKVKPKRKQL